MVEKDIPQEASRELYKGREIEILLTRYKEHAQHLRHLDLFDIRVAGGFIAVQLALASLFVIHPISNMAPKFAVIAIEIGFLIATWQTIKGSRKRRDEIVNTILNINEVFALKTIGAYLPNKMINPDATRSKFVWYEFACVIAACGAAFALFLPDIPIWLAALGW
jgi:hypothetical protein